MGSALLPYWSKVGGGQINPKSWSNVLWPPNNSVILDFDCPATPMPKFLIKMANRANVKRTAIQQDRSLLPVPPPPQGSLEAY